VANSLLLQPFNTIAGSIGSTIGALRDEEVNLFKAVQRRLLGLLTSALILFIWASDFSISYLQP
jgi:hypothetical protein